MWTKINTSKKWIFKDFGANASHVARKYKSKHNSLIGNSWQQILKQVYDIHSITWLDEKISNR
jgi:hypothetical protein